jgi:hypothetical protein
MMPCPKHIPRYPPLLAAGAAARSGAVVG